MIKKRLVVIGNGMAGARLVEEVLARGGREKYDIVMFGDEPHGNYNRILLSNVLAQSQDPRDIYLNPLEWYRENGVKLHSGVRVRSIDRRSRRLIADHDQTFLDHSLSLPFVDGRSTRTAQTLNSGIRLIGSRASFVSRLADPSPPQWKGRKTVSSRILLVTSTRKRPRPRRVVSTTSPPDASA